MFISKKKRCIFQILKNIPFKKNKTVILYFTRFYPFANRKLDKFAFKRSLKNSFNLDTNFFNSKLKKFVSVD